MNDSIFQVSAAIIIDFNNRILIQKKDSGYHWGPNKWSLVGGGIEEGENAIQAIKREIKEEIGIDFSEESIKFLGELLFEGELNQKDIKMNHNIFLVQFKNDISEIRIGEGAGISFFEQDELKDLNLMFPTKKILEKFYIK